MKFKSWMICGLFIESINFALLSKVVFDHFDNLLGGCGKNQCKDKLSLAEGEVEAKLGNK